MNDIENNCDLYNMYILCSKIVCDTLINFFNEVLNPLYVESYPL